jgi:hypothetical protein
VWHKPSEKLIWLMSYSGGMDERYFGDEALTKKVFSVLKMALLNVSEKSPFRGPLEDFIFDGLMYRNRVISKDLFNFRGAENIREMRGAREGRVLFAQDYHGGLVVPKHGMIIT